ncbi:MAG: hypothetical protein HY817_02775 [Candidatus Abawacabacteria bacterium]|nr:hypothetical protein [Candidatus Abawacabacteria bacterium]
MNREQELLAKMHVPASLLALPDLFRHLLAFWQHTSLFKRKCDRTGKDVISVFSKDCPYPVWYRDEWIKHANPPQAEFDSNKPFWGQLWDLFQHCPLPHNVCINTENCEYTDDWWYSKNCYLSHSGFQCEDVYYSYRVINCRNSFFCVFSNNCELCTDVINSTNCYNLTYGLDCSQCRDSAFLFDCRNCSDCMFCFNLRNKQYCIENKQYSKEEYEQKKQEYHFSSRKSYDQAKEHFKSLLHTQAWWRAQHLDQTENAMGDYLREVKDSSMAFFIDKGQDIVNTCRAFQVKDVVNSVGCFGSELVAYTVFLGSEGVYDIKYSVNLVDSKFMEYCMYCANCEHCFGCAGLVGKKYCILNKEYSPQEYDKKLVEIKSHLRASNEYGQLFPAYFAPGAYEESLATVYFPLSRDEQARLQFRVKKDEPYNASDYLPVSALPDDIQAMEEKVMQKGFWDEVAKRPFTIQKFDLEHSKKQQVPLPNCFYARRINENFSWMHFDGSARETLCAKTGQAIMTTLPKSLDGRIVSESAYQQILH